MKKRIILVSLLASILALAFSASALAKPPVIDRFEIEDHGTIPCGTFIAEVDNVVKVSVTTFSDENNNPTEYVLNARLEGTITNSETGLSVRDHAAVNFRGNLPYSDHKDEAQQGVFLNLHIPGEGAVALRVGRVVYDEDGNVTFDAGQGFDEWFESLVCKALG